MLWVTNRQLPIAICSNCQLSIAKCASDDSLNGKLPNCQLSDAQIINCQLLNAQVTILWAAKLPIVNCQMLKLPIVNCLSDDFSKDKWQMHQLTIDKWWNVFGRTRTGYWANSFYPLSIVNLQFVCCHSWAKSCVWQLFLMVTCFRFAGKGHVTV